MTPSPWLTGAAVRLSYGSEGSILGQQGGKQSNSVSPDPLQEVSWQVYCAASITHPCRVQLQSRRDMYVWEKGVSGSRTT